MVVDLLQLGCVLERLERYIGNRRTTVDLLLEEGGRIIVENVELAVAALVAYVQAEALLCVETAELIIVGDCLSYTPLTIGQVEGLVQGAVID